MLASCAVAAASGFFIYYYCDNEQESVCVVDRGRDYGVRFSAGVQREAPTRSSRVQVTSKENQITAVPPSCRQRSADPPTSRLTSQLSTGPVSTDHLRTARNNDEIRQSRPQSEVETIRTAKVTTDPLRTARNEREETSTGKRKVVVYTKQTYKRNVQTTAHDPKALLKDSTRQSVRLIPVAIDNPQVHTMQSHVDTQIIDGKRVNVEHRNEEMIKEDFRHRVLADSR
ncbi:hypothetical protein Aduo_003041 [Ancylostoma duodenale]